MKGIIVLLLAVFGLSAGAQAQTLVTYAPQRVQTPVVQQVVQQIVTTIRTQQYPVYQQRYPVYQTNCFPQGRMVPVYGTRAVYDRWGRVMYYAQVIIGYQMVYDQPVYSQPYYRRY